MAVTKLDKASTIAIRDCMGTKEGETILVITDENKREIGVSLHENAKKMGFESLLVEMKSGEINGEEPPKVIAQLMQKFDIVLCPTSKSLTHTTARINASKKGVRIATLPGITRETMIRGLSADYKKVAARSVKISHLLNKTKKVHITAPNGTDITLDVSVRNALASKGLIHKKGEGGNLPTGEAFVAPTEGKTEGVFVVDGSMAGIGITDKQPIRIEVENGLATKISGGPKARKLIKMLEPFGSKGRNIAELGIGTNDKAKLCGLLLEDEKVMGTIHIALGNNKSMGGKVDVPIHLDGVVKKPTVAFDNKLIMKDGKLLV